MTTALATALHDYDQAAEAQRQRQFELLESLCEKLTANTELSAKEVSQLTECLELFRLSRSELAEIIKMLAKRPMLEEAVAKTRPFESLQPLITAAMERQKQLKKELADVVQEIIGLNSERKSRSDNSIALDKIESAFESPDRLRYIATESMTGRF